LEKSITFDNNEVENSFDKRCRLLILDSISPLIGTLSLGLNAGFSSMPINNNSSGKKSTISQELKNDTGQYRNYLIDLIGSLLKRIAVECNVAVIVVNSVTNKDNKPALGQNWSKVASTRVLLSQQFISGIKCFQASIFKSSSLVSKLTTKLNEKKKNNQIFLCLF
jgi:hypothetical protein